MKNGRKVFLTLIFIVTATFGTDLDVKAAVVPNESGEVYAGYVYPYKYWNGTKWQWGSRTSWSKETVPITYQVTYDYEEAYKMLDLVNAERRKAGVPELKANDRMMQVAMERAAQVSCFCKHQIPDGSVPTEFSMFIDSENIGGSDTAEEANDSLAHSKGHYANMINKDWKYAGFGCVVTPLQGRVWVQIYCNNIDSKGRNNLYEVDGYPDQPIDMDSLPYGQLKNYKEDYTAYINPKFFEMRIIRNTQEYNDTQIEWIEGSVVTSYNQRDEDEWKEGDTVYIAVNMVSPFEFSGANEAYSTAMLKRDSYIMTSSNPEVVEVKDGNLICKKAGKAVVRVSLKAAPSVTATKEIEVREKEIKKGTEVTVADCVYKVTSVKEKTVMFTGGPAEASKVSIPDTVKLQGKTYKVTAVAANAFKGEKTLTQMTVGKNVTAIGKNAFNGCSGLKKITVKTAKLKSVGKNALKGIHKKAAVNVPKKKLAKYKKLFKGKGQGKAVKIKA